MLCGMRLWGSVNFQTDLKALCCNRALETNYKGKFSHHIYNFNAFKNSSHYYNIIFIL